MFFLLFKNISCAETACLLLRISPYKFLEVLEPQNFLASKNSCNEYFVEQTRDCWLELFSHLAEIFIIWKQQSCFEELFFRVLELQNFSMSKILAMNIFLSRHKSSQMLKAAIQPTVFLWICIHWESDICGQVNFYILSANQECRLLCLLADRVSKISRGWLQVVVLNAFAPCPLPHRFSFCTVVSLTLQTIKEKAHQKNRQLCMLHSRQLDWSKCR